MKFSEAILEWYHQNKRELPWRATTSPYSIWISEIILQQTRVDQGIHYYNKFLETFPDVPELANSNLDKVLKLWEGLGYYSRARNLHHSAKVIYNDGDINFPESYKKWIKIKGVGEYTAAAIASICYNEAVVAIDGNVYRVLSRIYGIQTPIDVQKGRNEFRQLAESLIDHDKPGDFNQAVIEFGALQCTPKSPNCKQCIFKDICIAFRNNKISSFPVKSKKVKIAHRHFNYLFIIFKRTNTFYTFIKRRNDEDIWKNLYELPLHESVKHLGGDFNLSNIEDFKNFIDQGKILYQENEKSQKLTHRIIHTSFTIVYMDEISSEHTEYIECEINNLDKYAFPKSIKDFLKTIDKKIDFNVME
ncbi:MAG: A/G-specific adenine glycosylase [Hyphomicrobiales bacterium]